MCSASAARIVHSTAVSLITGSIPGMPWQIGQTCVLGAASAYCAGQRQNILLAVFSCECTSSPMTVSNSPAPSGAASGAMVWGVGGEVIVCASYRACRRFASFRGPFPCEACSSQGRINGPATARALSVAIETRRQAIARRAHSV